MGATLAAMIQILIFSELSFSRRYTTAAKACWEALQKQRSWLVLVPFVVLIQRLFASANFLSQSSHVRHKDCGMIFAFTGPTIAICSTRMDFNRSKEFAIDLRSSKPTLLIS